MSGNFNFKVAHPYMSNNIPQMRSEEFQPAFFFGGSQVPNDLMITNAWIIKKVIVYYFLSIIIYNGKDIGIKSK